MRKLQFVRMSFLYVINALVNTHVYGSNVHACYFKVLKLDTVIGVFFQFISRNILSINQYTINIQEIYKLCAWRHNMPLPLQVDNIFVFIRQVAPVPACWLFKTSTS